MAPGGNVIRRVNDLAKDIYKVSRKTEYAEILIYDIEPTDYHDIVAIPLPLEYVVSGLQAEKVRRSVSDPTRIDLLESEPTNYFEPHNKTTKVKAHLLPLLFDYIDIAPKHFS